jgi:hypothetical protein
MNLDEIFELLRENKLSDETFNNLIRIFLNKDFC